LTSAGRQEKRVLARAAASSGAAQTSKILR
jgi:hypothetical protein